MERFDKITPANLPLENMPRTKVNLVFDITLQNDFGNAFRWPDVNTLDIFPCDIAILFRRIDGFQVARWRHNRFVHNPRLLHRLHIRKLLL